MAEVNRAPRHDFLFVDESGDPGYKVNEISGELLNSKHYTAAVLHLCEDSMQKVTEHMANFRFYRGWFRELKVPVGKPEFTVLLAPIRALAQTGGHVWATAVHLDKARYTGSYLKPGGARPQNSIWFRNYVLRRLLENHFRRHELQSGNYELVLDRYDMTPEAMDNLKLYLARNRNIPTPQHITHASSLYVEGLQAVHHIAAGFMAYQEGQALPPELSFVNARDLTTSQYGDDSIAG